MTTRSPGRRKSGSSRARACARRPSPRATSMRTSSRARPARLGRRVGLEALGELEGGLRAQARDLQVGVAVAPAGQVAGEQGEERGHALLGRRAVGDVLAGERRLVHRGVHVARVEGVDGEVRALGAEHVGELLERGLRRAVAAPALVGLDRGVGGDVDDPRAVGHGRERELDQAQRGERVDLQHVLEDVERIGVERRLRAGAEDARVVDERVDAVAGGGDEGAAVALVGDVADQRRHVGVRGQLAAGRLERVGAAGVDDQAPAGGRRGRGRAPGRGRARRR